MLGVDGNDHAGIFAPLALMNCDCIGQNNFLKRIEIVIHNSLIKLNLGYFEEKQSEY